MTGHSGAVLDIKWNPFSDDIIASCSDDTTVSNHSNHAEHLKTVQYAWDDVSPHDDVAIYLFLNYDTDT